MTCNRIGITGEEPFRMHVFGSFVSLLCSIFVAISLCSTPSNASDNMVTTSRRYISMTNFGNVVFSSVALFTSTDLYYHPDSGHDRIHMSLMLGWICSALFTIFWTLALYNNTYYLLSLPRMKGDINVLLANSRIKLHSHMKAAMRAALILVLTFFTTNLIFFIFTDRNTRQDQFPNLFVGFFVVFLFMDLTLLLLLLRVARSVRTLASMPLFANRIYICMCIGMSSLVWLCIVFEQALQFGSTNSLTKDSNCFYFWFNKALLPPVILSIQINSIAILTPRMVCGVFSLCCRSLSSAALRCAIGAETVGKDLDQYVSCCLESFAMHHPLKRRMTPEAREYARVNGGSDGEMIDRLEDLFEYMEIEPVIIPPQFLEVSSAPVAAGNMSPSTPPPPLSLLMTDM